ncbi:MAG: hypothetical protein LBV42_03325 [Methanobrevibacter sp.]|jgi:hypothetical protein|nr:hypothetical protein [Methanobrevibacter sp.]
MKKKYVIGGVFIVIVIIAIVATCILASQHEKGVCNQCKMLISKCHDHAGGDNECCAMCEIGNDSKCNCNMSMTKENSSMGMNNT